MPPRAVKTYHCYCTKLHLLLAVIGALVCVAVPPATAHIEDNFNAVHFHDGRPDFGTVPRRAIIAFRGEEDDRPTPSDAMDFWEPRSYVELTQGKDFKIASKRHRQRAQMMDRASKALAAGRVKDAEKEYSAVGHTFGWRQGMRTRVHLLELAQHREASSLSDVRRYNTALDADEANHRAAAATVFTALAQNSTAPWIRAYARYQIAAQAYETRRFPAALQGFRQILEGWNDQPLREDALIMMARSALQSGHASERALPQAQWVLDTLRRDFPKTRFLSAAAGLDARIDTLRGHYTQALAFYFSHDDLASVEQILKRAPGTDNGVVRPHLLAAYFVRLAHAASDTQYSAAVYALDRVRGSFSAPDAIAFSRLLPGRPDVAASYLYYRLYLTDAKPKDFSRLASLAGRSAQSWTATSLKTSASLTALTCTRVAEVYYQNRDYRVGLRWSRRSLAIEPTDRALFVEGACLLKKQKAMPAASKFSRLLARYPSSPLHRAAREELALASEKTGDFDTALDQYFALGYEADTAYTLDARMTIGQVQHYLTADRASGLRSGARRSLLLYTLGIRCLRAERYHDANRYLALVPRRFYRKYTHGVTDWDGSNAQRDPMTTAADLQRLKTGLETTHGRARAAAEYSYASYFYKGGTLLLYNDALWRSSRAMAFGWWWNPSVASPGDTVAERRHMYDHEVYARALKLCRDIANRYPRSPIAPAALYRAACCARKLAVFNAWWYDEANKAGLWRESVVLMKRVVREYPQSPLAPHARKYARVFAGEASDMGYHS